jgi:transcription initiation factor TFIIIB Brf1 subunit/transcription initiation factor TFIIB
MECNHIIESDEGERVCITCGEIQSKIIDEGAEWRNYEDGKGEDQCRTGFATSDLLPESSYGSVVSHRGAMGGGSDIKAIQRLSRWSLSSSSQRSWLGIFDAINTSCTRAGLPKSVIMDACGLYKKLEDAQKVRGETRRAMMGASVFVACRNYGAPRSHEEIGKMFIVNIRALCKAITHFSETNNSVLQTQVGIAERLCAGLGLDDDRREAIMDMLLVISAKSEDDFEHTPKTIVAGVVAHAMGLKTKTQMKPVADASGVSSLSIHKIVSKLTAPSH